MAHPGLLHPELLPLRQATADPDLCRRHSNTLLAQSLWGLRDLVQTKFVWTFLAALAVMGLLLCPWTWGIFFWCDPTFSCRWLHTREDSAHGHHQMVNTEIRLIIFFAAKDGEALYSQQKQDRELTVAQIMNFLLPNSDLNWRKYGKPLGHSGKT